MHESILDHEIVSSRYFFPRAEGFENPFWVECNDARLACYYQKNHADAKTIVFFHGNGEIVADYIDFFVPIFDQLGFNCFLAEYRGYGLSTGNPGLVKMLSDVKPVIQAIEQPPENLVLFGRSVGSIYAIHGASLFPGIAGLIIESGIAEVFERLLLRVLPEEIGITLARMEQEVATYFNVQEKLPLYKGPLLVLHARRDSLVHFSHGQRLYEWSPQPEGKKILRIFDNGDHNDIFAVNAQEYIQQLASFLSSL